MDRKKGEVEAVAAKFRGSPETLERNLSLHFEGAEE